MPKGFRAGLVDRLEAKTHRCDDGCWLWVGAKTETGYGVLGKGTREEGLITAHVASYETRKGPIPEGLVLDHLCRNRACVNPDHLEPVTVAENSRRGIRAKITMKDADRIRALCAQGRTQVSLAMRYGLHPATVSRIVSEQRWGKVDKPIERKRVVAHAG